MWTPEYKYDKKTQEKFRNILKEDIRDTGSMMKPVNR